MNPKYQKVCADIANAEKKVKDFQTQLKELYDKKTEPENLEIANTVRAMVMDKDQIITFLSTMKGNKPTKNETTMLPLKALWRSSLPKELPMCRQTLSNRKTMTDGSLLP